MDNRPPAWVNRLLEKWLPAGLAESVIGDLEEKFNVRVNRNRPVLLAKALYIIEAIGFARLAEERKGSFTFWFMLRHTIHFFTRLIAKNKAYYAVSILGLTISLASVLLIVMFVRDELSYDKSHNKGDRIYRLTTHLVLNDELYNMATSQFPAAHVLRNELPEVEQACRIFPVNTMVQRDEKRFDQSVYFADENFFEVFTFDWISTPPTSPLTDPGNIILTRAAAERFFGSEDPVGKQLVAFGQTFSVRGVIGNIPDQSHMKFDVLIPLSFQLNQWKQQSGLEGRENKWYWVGSFTYVLLQEGANMNEMRAKLPALTRKHFPERYRDTGHFELQPLYDIHLRSHLENELQPNGSILYVRLFTAVAIMILAVSTINLVNLSWFRLSGRIREVGIRKFLGQPGAAIFGQISLESAFQVIFAFILSLLLTHLLLTPFNLLVQKNMTLWSAGNAALLGVALLIIFGIGALAVLRPAWRYARRSASDLLLLDFRHSAMSSRFRNAMIGLQVCCSFILLVFSFVVGSQLEFFRNKDLGFNRNNLMVVEAPWEVSSKLKAFRQEVLKIPGVKSVTGADAPGNGYSGWRFVPEGGSYEKPLMMPFTTCDANFLQTMDVKLIAGHDFTPDYTDSVTEFIINERAAVDLGWKDDALGKRLELFAPGRTEIMLRGIVVGVMQNYHFESLHKPVKPLVITSGPFFNSVLIRIDQPATPELLHSLEVAWKQFTGEPFRYDVLETRLDRLYANEDQLSQVIVFFTLIALYLTCYGLFAMSSLLFSSRLKEVAIRKVFGADQLSIIRHFYWRYAAFTLAAIGIGLPVAFYIGQFWLDTFQYRITLGAAFFIKAGVWILAAGLLSVSYYLAKVAWSNPIKFLRSE